MITNVEQEVARAEQYIKSRVNMFFNALVRELNILGEQLRTIAIQRGSYTDRTGNLRSSIGYIIVFNGDIINEGSFGDSQQGRERGQEYARQLARTAKDDGLCVIVVAGMQYAQYVATKRDVLDSAVVNAPMLVNELKRRLGI